MDVSVILVNYNTLLITQKCIDSIFKETKGVEFEVILVDNASTDGSKNQFERDKRIIYIYSNKNLGFGNANNLGFKYSSGKYIFCLNTDTLLVNNAIKLFFEKMEKLPTKIGCLGTLLRDIDSNIIYSYGFVENFRQLLFKEKEKKHNYLEDHIHDENIFEVEYILGADLFIRRSIINKLGFFDKSFFLNYEEAELQYRYHKYGYSSCIYLGPQIIHLEGASKDKKYDDSRLNLHDIKDKQIRMVLTPKQLFYKKTKNHLIYFFVYLPYFFYHKIKIILGYHFRILFSDLK